jgi:hypothetical protein
MFKERLELYKQLEEKRQCKLLVYVTGDRSGLEAQIAKEVLHLFVRHLDLIATSPLIALYLYAQGGDTLASWSIVNLIRQFCGEFEVIVPGKAHSGGTLICLGANAIVMTKQATLSPIDPSINTPLNPQIAESQFARFPVSVEALNGFIEFAKSSLGEGADLKDAFLMLAGNVHPLVLGTAFRARTHIRMLASKLLAAHMTDEAKVNRILNFLCSESGSHDYTINRKEAHEDLGLSIQKPDDNLYKIIKAIYDDIEKELMLTQPYSPALALGSKTETKYSYKRALVESVAGGSDEYRSEGNLSKMSVEVQGVKQEAVKDARSFEGWRHVDA